MKRPMRTLAFVGASALLLTGCTGDPEPVISTSATSAPVPSISAPDVESSPQGGDVDVTPASYIVTAPSDRVDVYDEVDGTVTQTVAAEDVLSAPGQTPLTFLVKELRDDWAEVYLPVRPNGSTGWIPLADEQLTATSYRLEISLTDFTLSLFEGDDEVFTAEVGVGRDDRPTPGGVYYIRELLQPPDPEGVYGPFAYGLSGYSPVLDEFKGGEAIIGIHGTDEPDRLGSYVSSGCIRMANDAITELVTEFGVPLGTPVYISDQAADLTAA